MRLILFVLLVLIIIDNYSLSAQNIRKFSTISTYNSKSTELIERLRDQLSSELDEGTSDQLATIRKINQERFKILKELVNDEMVIHDDKFESCLNNIMARIIEANQLEEKPRSLLIVKTPAINAVNFGEGIFMVTLGLIARIRNEDELALALAHEMAHDELGHVKENILKEVKTKYREKTSESINSIVQGRSVESEVEALKKMIYQTSIFNRKKELEADSMGVILFGKAGYDLSQGKLLFDILKDPTSTKDNLGIDLLIPLHSEEYPIQDHWINERLSVYSKQRFALLGFSIDSLRSHPDIGLRQEKLENYNYDNATQWFDSQPQLQDIIRDAEFEMVELCYKRGLYDRCMFYALQLLHIEPGNTYLISRTSKIFLDLKDARDHLTFNQYVSKYTIGYSEQLKLVNNLLQNLSTKELGELGYFFISDKRHFNIHDPSHYYLKWKLCSITYRYDEEKVTKKRYKEEFKSSLDSYTYK